MAGCFVRGDKSAQIEFLNDCTNACKQAQSLLHSNLGRFQTSGARSCVDCPETHASCDASIGFSDVAPLVPNLSTAPNATIRHGVQPAMLQNDRLGWILDESGADTIVVSKASSLRWTPGGIGKSTRQKLHRDRPAAPEHSFFTIV